MTQIGGAVDKTKLWERYGEMLLKKFGKDLSARRLKRDQLPDDFVYENNMTYTEWIIRSYIRGGIARYEDIKSRVHPDLDRYRKLLTQKTRIKQIIQAIKDEEVQAGWSNPKEVTDINRFCGIIGCKHSKNETWLVPGLTDFLEKYDTVKSEVKIKAVPIYRDEHCTIYHPTTQEESCHIGRGTQWCTAANSGNMFDEYNKLGSMYIIVPTHRQYPKEKYQLHPATGQYMNDKDQAVPFIELLNRFPGIINVIPPIAEMSMKGEKVLIYINGTYREPYDERMDTRELHKLMFYLPERKIEMDLERVGFLKLGQEIYQIGNRTYLYNPESSYNFLPLKKMVQTKVEGLAVTAYEVATAWDSYSEEVLLLVFEPLSSPGVIIPTERLGIKPNRVYKFGEGLYIFRTDMHEGYFKIVDTANGVQTVLNNQPAIMYDLETNIVFYLPKSDQYLVDQDAIDNGLLKPTLDGLYMINNVIYAYTTELYTSHTGLMSIFHWEKDDYRCNRMPTPARALLSPSGIPLLNQFISNFNYANDHIKMKVDQHPRSHMFTYPAFILLCDLYHITGDGSDRIDYICGTCDRYIAYIYHGQIYHMDRPPIELLKALKTEMTTTPHVYEVLPNGDINAAIVVDDTRLWITWKTWKTWNDKLQFVSAKMEVYGNGKRERSLQPLRQQQQKP